MRATPQPNLPSPTARLRLRHLCAEDRDAFTQLHADPRVMQTLGGVLNSEQSDQLLARINADHERSGFGPWALLLANTNRFVGVVGLSEPRFHAPFTPCVEIVWRLCHDSWGNGYATEAARSVLRYGFERRGLAELVSFTSVMNARSMAVMERLGMQRDLNGDFQHPSLPVGHALRPHVLYRIRRSQFASGHDQQQ